MPTITALVVLLGNRRGARDQEEMIVDLSTAKWQKSSRSGSNGCVEVAFIEGQVAIRDSKDRHGPVLLFSRREWASFLMAAREGEFEYPGQIA
jgi:hypothetical protein